MRARRRRSPRESATNKAWCGEMMYASARRGELLASGRRSVRMACLVASFARRNGGRVVGRGRFYTYSRSRCGHCIDRHVCGM